MERFPSRSRPIIEKSDDLASDLEKTRARILEEIPSQTEGINIERVRTFLAQQGLTDTPVHFVSREQIPLLLEFIGQDDIFAKDGEGTFLSTLNMSFVIRDQIMEELNGPEYFEGIAVHELGHGSCEWNVKTIQEFEENGVHIRAEFYDRGGFSHQTIPTGQRRGDYFEEGFAQMLCARYMQDHMGNPAREYFSREFKCTTEQAPNVLFTAKFSYSGQDLHITTIPANACVTPKGERFHTAAFAAEGLFDLWGAVSGLEEAMKRSRTDPQALQEIPKLINQIDPGLYSFLVQLEYTIPDFFKGTERIREILGKK